MKAFALYASAALTIFMAAAPAHADPESCRKVKFSDLSWTDLSLTNATASVILTSLGYEPEQTILGLPVTFESLKNKDIDVFLGNWLPVQEQEFKSYIDNGDVDVLTTNLTGAKFTLAVPTYVAKAGVTSYDDLSKFSDKFNSTIYGIEAGSNQPLLDIISAGRHGLKDWNVVESSEAAMLTQVDKMTKGKEWIVFLAWAPHPMNLKFDLTYLSGGDKEYGPNFGGATVRTLTRKGYRQECPNVTKFLENLHFDIDYENNGMNEIMTNSVEPVDAARKLIKQYPDKLTAWLDGVKTFDGKDGYAAVKAAVITN
ncbi:choline ABC transporter substrate-binding protein [Mesorhizobium sp. B2-4-17]|uniref:choline ABC transporter substrate-binding protein n=1 Tax=Mesorhizobium sp. B2-4-17 TaxID=2589932 RepID=UPI0011285301|nr:choline ABC transporter substrate-binding protein [Mesorhizobium sp. B2-4-17]TPK90231.1 choline ABC transporter substrate-binding protein [Mesorhizobium sp. B2-4-17]